MSRVIARRGTDTVQNKKVNEPADILSQVNRTCPPVQTDTSPSGDSDMDVPITIQMKYMDKTSRLV